MAIRIVTDSAADVPADLARELGLDVVPLTIRFGSEEFRDGIDMQADAFYRRLARGGPLPATAQPSPAAFAEVYERAARAGERVVSIHLSGALSGTVQSARLAAEQVPNARVKVIDTRSASWGTGLAAIAAARAAREGAPDDEVIRIAEAVAKSVHILFLVGTLDYLVKNGRIGRAQGFVGSLLHVQPILGLADGMVTGVERVRGRARARQRLAERIAQAAQSAAGEPPACVAVMHADAREEAEDLAARLAELVPAREQRVGWLGPTIGAHTGPGCLGVVLQP